MSAVERAAWIRGVEHPLPAGERVLWEGAPDWRSLARRRFHARKVAVYFALLIAWRALASLREPEPLAYFLAGALGLLALGAAGVGAMYGLAWLVARTTTYAITDRRVLLRIGIALPALVNIPLRYVASAASQPDTDGTGSLALELDEENSLAWMLLWPHTRPLRFRDPQPALLCVPDAAAVGAALRHALLGEAATASPMGAVAANPILQPDAPPQPASARSLLSATG